MRSALLPVERDSEPMGIDWVGGEQSGESVSVQCAVQRLAATPGLDKKSGWHCAPRVLVLGCARDARDARVGA